MHHVKSNEGNHSPIILKNSHDNAELKIKETVKSHHQQLEGVWQSEWQGKFFAVINKCFCKICDIHEVKDNQHLNSFFDDYKLNTERK